MNYFENILNNYRGDYLKKYFLDEKGERNYIPFIISFIFIAVVIMLDQTYRYQESISEYFKATHSIIFFLLLLPVTIMSITKIIQTSYDKKADKFTRIVRKVLDGTIVLIIAIVSIIWLLVLLKIQGILIFLLNLLKMPFFINISSLIFSILIVSIIFSMIENVYIIFKLIIKKIHNDVEDIKEVYTIVIAILAVILSLLSLMN